MSDLLKDMQRKLLQERKDEASKTQIKIHYKDWAEEIVCDYVPLPDFCLHEEWVDTGMAVRYCKKCDQKERLINMVWESEND